MADEIRINRAPQPPSRPDSMVTGSDMHDGGYGRGPSKMPWVVLALVVLVLVVVGVLFRNKLFSGNLPAAGQSSGYQAVFLTNGQVYFGKLSNPDADYPTLKDIYYLQVTTPPGLQGSNSQANAAQQQQQQQLSLVKLGQELHGPVDSMQINRTQILFYEDMKEDGKVMQAIRQYQKNPPAAAPANSQSQVPAQQAPATAPAPTK